MIRARRTRTACLVAGLTMSSIGTAAALSSEQQCVAKRAAAAAKYVACVQTWLSKCSHGGGRCDPLRLSKCQATYSAVWPRLQLLSGSRCARARFEDNADGTVTDHLTELIWEKKSADAGLNDWSDSFDWSAPDGDGSDEDGSLFATFLVRLNNEGFAGANGWRLPTLAELMTLADRPSPCASTPCIHSAFGSYTRSDSFYWSATTMAGNRDGAWGVAFDSGAAVNAHKSSAGYVRAVRGGW